MKENGSLVSNCNDFDVEDVKDEVVEIQAESIFYVGSVIGFGSLSDSFKMTIHLDNTYSTTAESLAFGEPLFTKINWRNSISGMKFYIDTCTYSCGKFAIEIIKVRFKVSQVRG